MNRKETLTIQEYSFTVVYEPAEEGGYVVTCPALPAVVTQGETLEEARAMAADAIHLVLQGLIEDGEPIPADLIARPAHEPIRELLTVAVQGV
jgi:predicted RNase H-like HicB family nuclease